MELDDLIDEFNQRLKSAAKNTLKVFLTFGLSILVITWVGIKMEIPNGSSSLALYALIFPVGPCLIANFLYRIRHPSDRLFG